MWKLILVFTVILVVTLVIMSMSKIIFSQNNIDNYKELIIETPVVTSSTLAVTPSALPTFTVFPTLISMSNNKSSSELYPTLVGGRIWIDNWSIGNFRILQTSQRDPFDNEFIVRGNGTVTLDGSGVATMKGDSPRMYVYDVKKEKKWNNVEVTVYGMRVYESGKKSSQGIVIGARSEHQDATLKDPCFGRTYYGRLLYDGRAVFQKEVIHEGAYSINKPGENHRVKWASSDGTMPRNIWIGVKFIVKTNTDGKSVNLQLYRDLTDGNNGGNWEKVAEYNDDGSWSQTDSGADVNAKCGYSAGKVLLTPGTSVFIRNDLVNDVRYKKFSIREIQ